LSAPTGHALRSSGSLVRTPASAPASPSPASHVRHTWQNSNLIQHL
jgi:hypothetical protein